MRLTGYGPLGVTRRHRLAIHNDSALPSHGALEGISKFLIFPVQVLGLNYAYLAVRGRVRKTSSQAGQPLPAAMSSTASDQVARDLGQNAVICVERHGAT